MSMSKAEKAEKKAQAQAKLNARKVIGFKDVVTVVLFSVLTFIVSFVTAIPFSGSVYGMLFGGYALMALICGPIYLIMINKAPRIGTQILFFAVKALYMLICGQLLTAAVFFVGGLICEAICLGGGYKNTVKSTAAYALHTTLYGFGSFFPAVFLTESYSARMIAAGASPESVATTMSVYHQPLTMLGVALVLIVFSILGVFIGTKMFRKHFAPAGIA